MAEASSLLLARSRPPNMSKATALEVATAEAFASMYRAAAAPAACFAFADRDWDSAWRRNGALGSVPHAPPVEMDPQFSELLTKLPPMLMH